MVCRSDKFTAVDSEIPDPLSLQLHNETSLPIDSRTTQSTECLLFHYHYSKLSGLVNDLNLTLYVPKGNFTPRTLALAYSRYQNWYSELPEFLREQHTGSSHAVVLHMTYKQCLIQ